MSFFIRTLIAFLLLAMPAVAAGENLALNRPVSVSSTDWAPTPAEFLVDGETDTGWRAAGTGPHWLAIDLQGDGDITALRLVSEATRDANPFTGNRLYSVGGELLSACAEAYAIQVSLDGQEWTEVFRTNAGKGGREEITLKQAVTARHVRMLISRQLSKVPVGLNEFQVLGTCGKPRPAASGWTTRRIAKQASKPALAPAEDGTVPISSGWELICENWLDTANGARLSQPGLDTQRWYDATVPGTVLATLVDQGVFPDPAYGLANLRIPEALCRRNWWYRRTFTVPAGLDRDPQRLQWLEFDGIHHAAEVWLNGVRLGSLTAFRRGRFNVTAQLKTTGENVLALRFSPLPFPGSPGDKGTDGESWVNSVKLGLNEPTFLCASGWDWIPAIRDRATGILDTVRLRSSGPVLVGDPQVDTRLPVPADITLANLSISVPLHNASLQPQQVTVTIVIAPEPATAAAGQKITLSQTLTVPARSSLDAEFTPDRFPALAVHNPRLWWPNGYGRPDLHRLTIQADCANHPSDLRTIRFGMRDLRYRAAGLGLHDTIIDFPAVQARHVRIDCRQRTTKYGYSLWGFSVFDRRNPAADLALRHPVSASSQEEEKRPELACDGDPKTRWSSLYADPQWIAVDLGAVHTVDRVALAWEIAAAKTYAVQTSLDGRTWTEVKVMTEDPAEAANDPAQMQISVNGVRIFCRGGNWGYDELLHRGGQERMDTAVRLQRESNFTMIRNWTGAITRPEFYQACDENGILVFNDFWSSGFRGPPTSDSNRLQLYLRAAQDTILRYRHHPCIAFWCGCNENFPPKAEDNGVRRLIASHDRQRLYLSHSAASPLCGFGPYGWVNPTDYATVARGFKSEIGIPTVPVAESMRRLAGDQPAWPVGAVWNYHDWCPSGGQVSNRYRDAFQARLGEAKTLDDFCSRAQFINYESMRAIFESWNHKLWNDCSAVLIWMSHPAWMSTTWQTYDYDFEVNGSYFGAKKACEPVHVQAMLTDWSVDVLNHTAQGIPNATVTAALYSLDGKRLGEVQTKSVDLPPSGVVPVFTAAWPAGIPPLHLLRLELRDQAGKLLSENVYWRYLKPENMQALNTLAPTTIAATVTTRIEGPRTVLSATIANAGPTVAVMVTLSLRRAKDDSRVLPAFHSDGCLWLLPGETRTVTIECATGSLNGSRPALRISGYNLPAITIEEK